MFNNNTNKIRDFNKLVMKNIPTRKDCRKQDNLNKIKMYVLYDVFAILEKKKKIIKIIYLQLCYIIESYYPPI